VTLKELLDALRDRGVEATESKIRWAIRSGKIARPPIDGSLRYRFGEDHFMALLDYFREQERQTAVSAR
jgi:hypothetical protein